MGVALRRTSGLARGRGRRRGGALGTRRCRGTALGRRRAAAQVAGVATELPHELVAVVPAPCRRVGRTGAGEARAVLEPGVGQGRRGGRGGGDQPCRGAQPGGGKSATPSGGAVGRTIHGVDGSSELGGLAANGRTAREAWANGNVTRQRGGFGGASGSGWSPVGGPAGAELDRGDALDARRCVVAVLRRAGRRQRYAVTQVAQRAGMLLVHAGFGGCVVRRRLFGGLVPGVATRRDVMGGRQVDGRVRPAAQGQQGQQQPDDDQRARTHIPSHAIRITQRPRRCRTRWRRPPRRPRLSFLQCPQPSDRRVRAAIAP